MQTHTPQPAALNRPTLRRSRGLTLIETCTVMAVGCTLLGLAAPNLKTFSERRELEAVSAQMRTNLAHARSLAAAQGLNVQVQFSGPRCVVTYIGPTTSCQCNGSGQALCVAPVNVLHVMHQPQGSRVSWQSNSTHLTLDAAKGTVTPTATVRITSQSGLELRNVVNLMGRVRQCAATAGLAGYPAC
ncbi:MAG: Tfp pilus assembly protein FimT/FimU [Rubrivivax sp.]|jgi:type IV fimbrial biogenesis protein FimT